RSPELLWTLRIGTVFGAGETGPRAIPAFARALVAGEPAVVQGDGADVRDFVHVRDVAAAVVNACGRDRGRAVNVGSGSGRSTNEILAAVARTLGAPPYAQHEPAARPPSRLVLSVTLARDMLSVAPSPGFDAELKEETSWVRAAFQ